MLWIRTGFNADPDPAIHLNVDPYPDQGVKTNADPDPGQTLTSQKVEFLHEKYNTVGKKT